MDELVFIESEDLKFEPFTTDEIITEFSGNSRESVTRLIRNYQDDLTEFGKLGFEIRPMPSGQKSKVFHLNQQQATLLITYLDNTEPVRKFKKELVKQFYEMEIELTTRRLERAKGKGIRCSMTDAIRDAGFSSHFYKHFTDLVYKKALGFNAKQLREARGAKPKATPLDFLTTKEQAAVNQIEELVSGLIQLGRSYDDIKLILNVGVVVYQTTLKMPETASLEV
ncbi:Rha family transcriptional regulator [Enterococcus pseudoavium]|uniref:Rha family transcriptional regulator n=1 Tax=Enterococcus pseudoavium TaxID=44007 RepID=A0ABU3FFR1_9ENTE|nr:MULTISPECIES: Rha family transcriptional regulator [Enterococcus]MDT2604695.1 Rha family transcriptional regulator [Enterococcus dongliensis]MDT2769876.1 Rha family transcriptional regulator [Enterococcus pseudoavium]